MAAAGCQVCGRQMTVLKRCTRCQHAFYCSRECQVSDWKSHKADCRLQQERLVHSTPEGATRGGVSSARAVGGGGEERTKDIWGDTGDLGVIRSSSNGDSGLSTSASGTFSVRREGKIKFNFTPRVDFEGANKRLIASKEKSEEAKNQPKESTRTYLCRNVVCSDLPVFDVLLPNTEITVKSNKEKHKIQLNNCWGWDNVSKVISHVTEIPLEKMKVISKGKLVLDDDSFWALASRQRALFQVIGVRAESEQGLLESDVNVVMRQMCVDRNDAVRALRNASGDVIDAMLQLGNR